MRHATLSVLPSTPGARFPSRGGGLVCRLGLIVGGGLLLLGTVGPAGAARLPLPADEQAQVNRAIDRGVAYLKATQRPYGTWTDLKPPKMEGPHRLGYAALPALTLLECGVPRNDPVVQRAARFVRRVAPTTFTTYEVSLSILFLDRLGDPKDEPLIRSLAMRLVTGQTPTGGWGYKVPRVTATVERELLTVLRQLDPQPTVVLKKPEKPDLPDAVATRPARPGPEGGPVVRPPAQPGGPVKRPGEGREGGPVSGIPVVGNPEVPGIPTGGKPAGGPASTGPTTGPRGSTPSDTTTRESSSPGTLGPDSRPLEKGGSLSHPPSLGPGSLHRGGCIKITEGPVDEDEGRQAPPPRPRPQEVKPQPPPVKFEPKEVKPEPAPASPPPKKVSIPRGLRGLPVLQDPNTLPMADPNDRPNDLFLCTTDNSNSQFALLALWAAQRHNLPLGRSLKLLARRYDTSQNRDGSWSYNYRFGGGDRERPAATAVGLLGLAVGHGLTNPDGQRADKPLDPRVLNGFVALSKHVGAPAGRMENLPGTDLYLLWSIERVGVLYNLATIGNKDWYRWGAEILVANQQPDGFWKDGRYHGAQPVTDTCFALLFLKRANLTRDLPTPFRPEQLTRAIDLKVTPPPPLTKSPPPQPTPTPPPLLPKSPGPAPEATPLLTKPDPPPGSGQAAAPGEGADLMTKAPADGVTGLNQPDGPNDLHADSSSGEGGGGMRILVFSAGGLLLLLLAGLLLALYLREHKEGGAEEEEPDDEPAVRRTRRRTRTEW